MRTQTPTIWTCRPLATYPDAALRLALRIFRIIGRGDFYLA